MDTITILERFGRLSGWGKTVMVVCLLKLLSWSNPSLAQTLPCLDSSKECVEQLTELAIANSSKLKTLDDRIALIDRRIGVSKDSIDYAESKLWTNYLPSSTAFGGGVLDIINPFSWIKSLAGGIEVSEVESDILMWEVFVSNSDTFVIPHSLPDRQLRTHNEWILNCLIIATKFSKN